MQNIDMQREGDQLVIRVDLSKNLGRSRSGKTTIIATTSGNKVVPDSADHGDPVIGLNIYRK